MVTPSVGTTAVFVLIVAAIAIAFVVAVGRAGRARGESPAQRTRAAVEAAAGVAALMAVTGWASASGVLETSSMPPTVMFFFGGSMLVVVATGLSPVGARLARGTPIAALVAFQAFRLPLELVLHRWADEGVLPVQMTYEGHNFDIVTGIAAVVTGAWLWRNGPSASPRLVAAFNLLGLALLVTVASIAIRSTPGPLRTYDGDPPVLLAFHFPYGWIVPMCVGGALLGHIVVFRWLAAHRRGALGSA